MYVTDCCNLKSSNLVSNFFKAKTEIKVSDHRLDDFVLTTGFLKRKDGYITALQQYLSKTQLIKICLTHDFMKMFKQVYCLHVILGRDNYSEYFIIVKSPNYILWNSLNQLHAFISLLQPYVIAIWQNCRSNFI